MFIILMGILCICSIGFFALSKNEKDYQNCIKLNGEKFTKKRKKILQILGPILFIGSFLAILFDILI